MTPDHRAVEIKSLLSFSFSVAGGGPCERGCMNQPPAAPGNGEWFVWVLQITRQKCKIGRDQMPNP